MQYLSNKKGFTLIELLVVISIIGLLSSIVLASLSTARQKGYIAKVKGEMQSLKNAVELYYLDNNEYPHDSDFFLVNSQFNTYLGKYLNSTIDINVIPGFTIISGYPYMANTARFKIERGTEYPYHCGDTQSTRNPYIIYFRTTNKEIADKIFPVFRYNSNNTQLVLNGTQYYYCAFLPS